MVIKSSIAYQGTYYYTSGGSSPTPRRQVFTNLTEMTSINHPNWRSKSDGGGPFSLVSTKRSVSPMQFGPGDPPWLRGPVATYFEPASITIPSLQSKASLYASGTTAIAKVLPNNSTAELSTALGELGKDGLPHIIGSSAFKNQVHTAHKAGDEFLNVEFGWLPLVSDLKKFAKAVKHRDRIMSQYVKYSDKQIRRRYEFPSSKDTGVFTQYGYIENDISYPIRTDYTGTYESKRWFSGAFRYHVPTPTGFAGKAAYYRSEADKLLGLNLTPEVVWNLAPWSWAVDWFSNTGDILHNISKLGQDGMVMRYGYIMCSTISTRSSVATGRADLKDYMRGKAGSQSIEIAAKQRLPATPYGFGLSFESLSNTQKAVIAALGLTRVF